MQLPALNNLSPKELLRLSGSILDELQFRGIARTTNNPVSDYTEWLVSKRMELILVGRSKKDLMQLMTTGSDMKSKLAVSRLPTSPDNSAPFVISKASILIS